jgi:hypothetical protein
LLKIRLQADGVLVGQVIVDLGLVPALDTFDTVCMRTLWPPSLVPPHRLLAYLATIHYTSNFFIT